MIDLARISLFAVLIMGSGAALAADPAPAPAAPAAAAPTAAAPAPITVTGTNKEDAKDPDQVVCRREVDTGSRIKTTKTCMSRRQWAEQGRETSRAIAAMPSASGVTGGQ